MVWNNHRTCILGACCAAEACGGRVSTNMMIETARIRPLEGAQWVLSNHTMINEFDATKGREGVNIVNC